MSLSRQSVCTLGGRRLNAEMQFLITHRPYCEAVVNALWLCTVDQSAVGCKTVDARLPWELWSITTPLPQAAPSRSGGYPP